MSHQNGRAAGRYADVVVVGGGPAGAAAAIAARRHGLDVLVCDKARFPRDKYCGDGLTAGALRLLEDLGLEPGAVASWTVVDDVIVRSPSGFEATFPMPRGQGQFAAVARRADLDAALLDVAREAGADVADGHACTGVADTADFVDVAVAGLGVVRTQYVIAADGMWSPVRKMVGADEPGYLGEWHAFRQYFADVGPRADRDLYVWFEADLLPGYAWSFPLGDGLANVGFGVQRGGKVATREMKALWPSILARPHVREVLGPAARPEAPHRAWPIPARVDRIVLAAGRVLFTGDAAAATDPMTGEGIAQALVTGVHAADAVATGGPVDADIVRAAYEDAVRQELVADHQMSRMLIRALRHRKGARAAIRVAGASPWTRRNFARWLFEDYPRSIITTPRRWRHGVFTGRGAYEPAGTSSPAAR